MSHLLLLFLFLISCAKKEDSDDVLSNTPILSEEFSTLNTDLWFVSDNYSNNGVFNCDWSSDHVSISDGVLTLLLNNTLGPSKSYTSGEFRSQATYQYGRFGVRMRPAKNDGIVSSFFIYSANPHDEIDLEFLGKDTTRVQLNYFKNGVGGNEVLIDLGFDASLAFHDYAIEWRADSIAWYVDGEVVHTVTGNTGSLPSTPGYVYANLWNGIGVDSWLNAFNYSGELQASYDRITIYR